MIATFVAQGQEMLEEIMLKNFNPQNINRISIATSVFQDNDYFALKNVIPLDSNLQKSFAASLQNLKWHNSVSVSTRADAEFVIIVETKSGRTFGLHASNGLESDCFHIVQISLEGKPYINKTYYFERIKKIDGQFKTYHRVLRVPGWRTTQDGRKLLSTIDDFVSKITSEER